MLSQGASPARRSPAHRGAWPAGPGVPIQPRGARTPRCSSGLSFQFHPISPARLGSPCPDFHLVPGTNLAAQSRAEGSPRGNPLPRRLPPPPPARRSKSPHPRQRAAHGPRSRAESASVQGAPVHRSAPLRRRPDSHSGHSRRGAAGRRGTRVLTAGARSAPRRLSPGVGPCSNQAHVDAVAFAPLPPWRRNENKNLVASRGGGGGWRGSLSTLRTRSPSSGAQGCVGLLLLSARN